MAIRLRYDVNTKFHIDLGWWEKNNKDIRIYLKDLLCSECRAKLAEYADQEEIDWVDPVTAEVKRVDPLWHTIRVCCSTKPNYIKPETPIVDAVFLTLLANGNEPLSVRELYERIDKRPPETILRMLTSGKTYLGIRPLREEA